MLLTTMLDMVLHIVQPKRLYVFSCLLRRTCSEALGHLSLQQPCVQ